MEEGGQTHLTATIGAGRILSGKEHEVRMWLDHFSQLWHVQLSVVIQQPALHQSDAESISRIPFAEHLSYVQDA